MATRTVWEKVEAGGTRVVEALVGLVNEGNIRRVRIRQHQRTVAEFPLTVGVVGAVFAPILAAVGAITALATDCSIEVEREVEAEDAAGTPPTDPAEAPIG
jgi:hypothetical protein